MIRAVLIAIVKELRLLRRDPIGFFMLIVAPIAVIAAAGFSLSSLYGGGASSYAIAVANQDGGRLGRAIVDGLGRDRSLVVLDAATPEAARAMVREQRRAIVAIVIPAGTSKAFEDGLSPRLVIYSDPVRYLETVKIELALAELSRRLNMAANDEARQRFQSAQARLKSEIDEAARQAEQVRDAAERLARSAERSQADAKIRIRGQIDAAIADAREKTMKALGEAVAQMSSQARAQAASQWALLGRVRDYLQSLEQTRIAFQKWFAELQAISGSRASSIPPPPSFPQPPTDLTSIGASEPAPPDFDRLRAQLEKSIATPEVSIDLHAMPVAHIPEVPKMALAPAVSATIPGTIGFREEDSNGAEAAPLSGFNAFDLQVPGFAVTFSLIDEREWGTLDRLRAAAAPLGATFAGKLLARFAVGFVQMAVLFAAGWLFFGISLGRSPWALFVPSASIAFAGAAFGLLVAGVGRSRDAVLPVGAIVIMTMAAVGGCWWPIDFEPHWMQTAALAVPTTWAMRAFNDLMIRRLSVSSALLPSAINLAYGVFYMIVGIAVARRRFAP